MQAYFADIRSRIVERLEQAENSILIAMAWFTNEVIFQLLLDKAASGTDIQIILSNSEINFDAKFSLPFQALQRKGVKVSVFRSFGGFQFMHHKFAIIDNKEVITGSYNWSNNAHTNHENILVINDPEISKTYRLQFETLLKNESIISFDQFNSTNNTSSLQDSVHGDETLSKLSREFAEAVEMAMAEARTLNLGIRMDIIEGMIKRYTAVGAAKKLSNDTEQSGFIKLVTENRSDLTFEYLTAKSQFVKLFDKVTVKNAKAKLKPYIGEKVNNI